MMKISLLIDHPEAVEKIAKWYYDEWASIAPQMTEEMMYQKVLEKAANRDVIPLAIVVHHEKELIGVLELKLRENNSYPEYEHWIGGIFVDPLWRGQGIAGQMISKIKEKARKLGVKTLYLQCENYNVVLYQKYGFEILHKANYQVVETTIMRYQQ